MGGGLGEVCIIRQFTRLKVFFATVYANHYGVVPIDFGDGSVHSPINFHQSTQLALPGNTTEYRSSNRGSALQVDSIQCRRLLYHSYYYYCTRSWIDLFKSTEE